MAPHRPTFRDHDCEPVNVASLPIPRPPGQHAALQTDKVQLRNMRIQASALQDAEAQTDGFEPTEEIEKMFVSSQEENSNDKAGGAGGKKGGASSQGKWLISRDPRFDPNSMRNFLAAVAPRMLAELNENVENFEGVAAFRNYEPKWDSEDADQEVQTVLTLSMPAVEEGSQQTNGTTTGAPTTQGADHSSSGSSSRRDLAVLDCVWNCTGNVAAVAYGRLDTLGWCDDGSRVCVWNVFGRGNRGASASLDSGGNGGGTSAAPSGGGKDGPDLTIEVLGEIVSLAFHPKLPNILAGGSYNGELCLWDAAASGSDPQIAMSSIDDYFHREAIQSVEWVGRWSFFGKNNPPQVLSLSTNGSVGGGGGPTRL